LAGGAWEIVGFWWSPSNGRGSALRTPVFAKFHLARTILIFYSQKA
jgi:hypothetical protein